MVVGAESIGKPALQAALSKLVDCTSLQSLQTYVLHSGYPS